ncbi:FMR1-interacting protein NUFIP1 [Lutzomyia longipalpis]|uniref:FMR1-interacting protein NUFIP1 n=1 Tax=Lutzomyia longipalpis TaxID=7200 RepID=UPI002483E65D|nr:FMR1-interacting protein NUFIP1 [Lutzomyia longipalpis]
MENPPQFDIESLQKNAPYSAPFIRPHVKQYPPHFIPQQPSMFGAHGSTIPPQYLPPYQAPSSRRSNFNPYNRARKEIWCETCEWSFFSIEKFEQHKAEHKRCEFDGCAFEGHSRLLAKHLEIHNSKLGSIESAEDIAKWREERRKNYPTAKNIELRRKAQVEKNKRGERISERKTRFGEKLKGQFKSSKNQFRKRTPTVNVPASPEETCLKEELNQGVSMFRGTSSIEDYVDVQNNVLAQLLSVYESGSESESEGESKEVEKQKDETVISKTVEHDLPKEHKISSQKNEKGASHSREITAVEKPEKFTKRKFSKDAKDGTEKPTKIYKGLNYDFLRRRHPPTMLSKLLEKEIRHERNVLFQCVRYVVEKDFLGVAK